MTQSNHPIARSSNHQIAALCVALAGCGILPGKAEAQMRPAAVAATRVHSDELRAWDQQIDQMLRARDLRVRHARGRHGRYSARALDSAPPGFAGWTIPVEPLLSELQDVKGFSAVLERLAARAR